MKKKIKYPLIISFAILYLVSEALGDKFLPDYSFFWSLVSVIGCLSIYFYNDSILIFSFFNKKYNKFIKKPQVTWEISHSLQTTSENCFHITNEKLSTMLADKSSDNFKILNREETFIEYEVELPDIRKYKLHLEIIEEDLYELTIHYKCTLSYNQSQSELKDALQFFQTLTQHINIYDEPNIEGYNELFLEPNYLLILSFTGFNPFYGLMTKRLDEREINSFSLIFNQENSQIEIEKNILKIQSTKQDELHYIVNNYLALSDLT